MTKYLGIQFKIKQIKVTREIKEASQWNDEERPLAVEEFKWNAEIQTNSRPR